MIYHNVLIYYARFFASEFHNVRGASVMVFPGIINSLNRKTDGERTFYTGLNRSVNCSTKSTTDFLYRPSTALQLIHHSEHSYVVRQHINYTTWLLL